MRKLSPDEIVKLAEEYGNVGGLVDIKMAVILATGLHPSTPPNKKEYQMFARNFDCVNISIVMPYMITSEMYSA